MPNVSLNNFTVIFPCTIK